MDFSETLTRARFEELNADLFKNTLGPVKQVGFFDCVLGQRWLVLANNQEIVCSCLVNFDVSWSRQGLIGFTLVSR